MKQNCKVYLAALLLVGAVGMMTAGAQGSGNKPTLAVFVVGDNTISSSLATALGANLTSGGRYTLTSASTGSKLTELQATYAAAAGGSSINRDALAAWGRTNNISAICLVVDDKKGNDHLFSAQLIDAKDSKLSGKGSYVRTNVAAGDATRVALALSQQLAGQGRRRSAPASTRSYPAELDIEMVRVEGGTFTMGCTPEQGANCNSNEKPAHSVTVSSFSIGKYEITQAQWVVLMGSNPSNNKTDDQLPVEKISWYQMVEFCNTLSARVGLMPAYAINGTTVTLNPSYTGYRLPTEAEWEYAARGCKGDGSNGVATCENLLYSGSDNIDEVGWYKLNSSAKTHVVGQKKPNKLGIYDMTGNVWEWVYDRYDAYTNAAATNPTGSLTGTIRVLRSGGWDNDEIPYHRVTVRSNWLSSPSSTFYNIGFRVVLPAQ